MSATTDSSDRLARLNDEERNFLILYRAGGPNSVVTELGVRRENVESRLATIKQKLEAEDWPHTNGVVRRQVVVDDGDGRREGQIKRAREGLRVGGPMLAERRVSDDTEEDQNPAKIPAKIPDRPPPDVEADDLDHDPRQSPILDWLEKHGNGSAPQIAEALNRKVKNVSTRLRQLERGGFVRRTGRTIPGGRGGPQIEWELCDEDKPPTSPDDVLDSPFSQPLPDEEQSAMRRAYFARLLDLVAADAPAHIFDRIERLVGLKEAA